MLDLLTDLNAWAALASLTALEIVLGVDNVVFISILVGRLDPRRGEIARRVGLGLALIFRIALLFALTSLLGLSATVFTVWGNPFSWHDLILIGGGLFLIAKATHEMHREIDIPDADEIEEEAPSPAAASMGLVIVQLVVIDLVFSIDSIVTAIGMSRDIRIMIAAVLIAVAVMYAASGPVARFVANHPTTKMLALAFLLLIGVALVADGFDFHIPRGYIYFADGVRRRGRGLQRAGRPRAPPFQEEIMTARKIVLVTGSSRGIGAATARLAAAQGYDVAVNYARDKEGAATVVADIEKAGRRAVAIQADVGREDDVARLFETIDDELGRLTDLVYNAGITGPVSRIESLSDRCRPGNPRRQRARCGAVRARRDPAAVDGTGRGRAARSCCSRRRWRRSAAPANT